MSAGWIVVSIGSPDPEECTAWGTFETTEAAEEWMNAQPDEMFENAGNVQVWFLNGIPCFNCTRPIHQDSDGTWSHDYTLEAACEAGEPYLQDLEPQDVFLAHPSKPATSASPEGA